MRPLAALVLSGLLTAFPSSLLAQTGFTTQVIPTQQFSSEILSADFNGDHKPDLLVGGQSTQNGAQIYLNASGSGAPYAQPFGIQYTQAVSHYAIADLNGDGFPDIAACYSQIQYGAATGPFSVVTFFNDGTGHFALHQTSATSPGVCQALTIGDVNRDGHPDVVTASQVPPVSNSSPTLAPPHSYVQTWFSDAVGNLGTPVTESDINLNVNSTDGCGVTSMVGGNFFGDGNFNLLLHTNCYTTNGGASGPITTRPMVSCSQNAIISSWSVSSVSKHSA